MNGIQIRLLDGRLRQRSAALVKQHFRAATSAQALWRFLANERVTLPALIEPPRELARQVVNGADCGSRYVLLAHDWSKLTYPAHRSKRDQVGVSHDHDRGDELTASLLELQLWSADGVQTTRQDEVAPRVGHLFLSRSDHDRKVPWCGGNCTLRETKRTAARPPAASWSAWSAGSLCAIS